MDSAQWRRKMMGSEKPNDRMTGLSSGVKP